MCERGCVAFTASIQTYGESYHDGDAEDLWPHHNLNPPPVQHARKAFKWKKKKSELLTRTMILMI